MAGSGVCCGAPVFGLDPPFSYHPALLASFPLLLLFVVLCIAGGGVRWCVLFHCGIVSRRPLLSLCLPSQHCWFRVVCLWQGCVIVEWR